MVDFPTRPVTSSPPTPTGFPPGTVFDVVAQMVNGNKEDGDRLLRITNERLRRQRNEINELGNAQIVALQKVNNASYLLSFESYGYFLQSAATIGGGCYLKFYCQEVEAGDKFIRSGVILLVNTLMVHINGWNRIATTLSLGNRTVEVMLQTALPFTVTIVAYVWNAPKVSQVKTENEKTVKGIELFIRVITVPLEFGRLVLKVQQGLGEREVQYIETQTTFINSMLKELVEDRSTTKQSTDSRGSDLRGAIREVFSLTTDLARNS